MIDTEKRVGWETTELGSGRIEFLNSKNQTIGENGVASAFRAIGNSESWQTIKVSLILWH